MRYLELICTIIFELQWGEQIKLQGLLAEKSIGQSGIRVFQVATFIKFSFFTFSQIILIRIGKVPLINFEFHYYKIIVNSQLLCFMCPWVNKLTCIFEKENFCKYKLIPHCAKCVLLCKQIWIVMGACLSFCIDFENERLEAEQKIRVLWKVRGFLLFCDLFTLYSTRECKCM